MKVNGEVLPADAYRYDSVGSDLKATKLQVKQAVEKFYSVKVRSVRTMVMPRRRKRYGRQIGMAPRWKKAIVTLVPGQSLQIVEGQ